MGFSVVSKKYVEFPEVNGKMWNFQGLCQKQLCDFPGPLARQGPYSCNGLFQNKKQTGDGGGGWG